MGRQAQEVAQWFILRRGQYQSVPTLHSSTAVKFARQGSVFESCSAHDCLCVSVLLCDGRNRAIACYCLRINSEAEKFIVILLLLSLY
jgi:hypothetical protein